MWRQQRPRWTCSELHSVTAQKPNLFRVSSFYFFFLDVIFFLMCILQAKGQASSCWSEESKIQSARRGSSYFTFCIQFMEEQQIFKCLVLREFCSDTNTETCPRCEETVTWNYGQVNTILYSLCNWLLLPDRKYISLHVELSLYVRRDHGDRNLNQTTQYRPCHLQFISHWWAHNSMPCSLIYLHMITNHKWNTTCL
jgi:hypothetical protein